RRTANQKIYCKCLRSMIAGKGGGWTSQPSSPDDPGTRGTDRSIKRIMSPEAASQQFVNGVAHVRRSAPADTHRHDLVQPDIFWRRGFEERSDAEVVLAGVDRLAAPQPADHIRWCMEHAFIACVDQSIVVRAQSDANVKSRQSIGSNERPVAAARQDD